MNHIEDIPGKDQQLEYLLPKKTSKRNPVFDHLQ